MNHEDLCCDNSNSTISKTEMLHCENIKTEVLTMDTSEKLLSSRLISLVKNGQWEKYDVVKLFKALVEQFKGRNDDFHTWMMRILYQVEIHRIKVSDLTSNESKIVDHVETKVNEIVKNTKEKTLQEILEEICQQGNVDEKMMAEVKDIVSSVSDSLSLPTAPPLQGIKQILFKLCKAVEKTRYIPRLTQMVSWCILVLSESSRLVQVGTGEGKSCIVAMFAAYQALMGKTPDIISSSPVLAERDAEEWSDFYKTLEITVDVNTNKSTDNELRKCYECQVVYGTTQSFAGDWLRQRFHRKEVRPNRVFHCAIVDEVDSLMLDKGLEVVYLNSNIPSMEPLNGILAQIWFTVNQIKHLDSGEILGPTQCFSQLLSDIMHENKDIDRLNILQTALDAGIMPNKSSKQMQENMKIVQKQLHDASVVQMVAFLTIFVANFPEYFFHLYQELPVGTLKKLNKISPENTTKRQEISILLLGNGKYRVVHFEEDSLITSTANRITMGYETTKRQNESGIPGLDDLIKGKVHVWIKNALEATKMTLGHEYILHEDGVAPVDYKCTGVVQNDMRWGDGLQQFLEMKHQTKLTNMDLITNFMSNVGLFKKYQNQIYGITGTLGDQTELDMLKKLYNGIETYKIPSFRPRKLYELEGLVIQEEEDWIRTVCNVVQEQVSSTVYRGPRAALVICETINRAQMIHRALAETVPTDKLKLYVNNNMNNSKIIDSKVQKSHIIIATNLAGRGTDLKVCEDVNEAGGLFVLQTFLPLNVRVEQQAFGRTARQGSPGSAQLIMCASHLSNAVKMVMGIKSPMTTLLSHLDHVMTPLISFLLMPHGSTEDLFEIAVHHYLKDHCSHTHKAMVSALTGLLTMKSMPLQENSLEKAKDGRNFLVNIRLSGFLEKDIPEIIKKEEIFSVYLDILDRIYENEAFSDQCDVIVPSLHECWGLWLLMHFSEEKSFRTMKEHLEEALLSAKQTFLSRVSPSSMVYYYIRSGNDLRKKGRLAESIEMYTKALEDGASGEIIPLYNRALATIMKKDTGYITRALADLEKADRAIDLYKLHLALIHTCVKISRQGPEAEVSVPLQKQFLMKCIVLYILKTNIQDSVVKLKRAESRGSDVRLTETPKNTSTEDNCNLHPPEFLKELVIEYIHVTELGLDNIFSLDVTFSFSGFLSKMLKLS